MVRTYLALLRRSIGVMLEYRVSMLIWMLAMSLPLVMLAVWLSLAEDGPVGSYSAADFVAYYILTMYVREMTAAWVSWELDSAIRHGDLAVLLLHPLNPIHEYLSTNLADKLLRVVLLTPLLVGVAVIVPGVHYALSPVNVALFLLLLGAAWYLRFMSQYLIGLLSFWISQATTLQDLLWMFFLLFGGVVAPLALLPDWMQTVAVWLPFRYMLSFPIEILMGRLAPAEVWTGLAACAGWMLVHYGLYRWMWRRGLRVFSAYGA